MFSNIQNWIMYANKYYICCLQSWSIRFPLYSEYLYPLMYSRVGYRMVSILIRYYCSLQIWILVCATIIDNFLDNVFYDYS